MKAKSFKSIILMLLWCLMLLPQISNAGKLDVELSGSMLMINEINLGKKFINLGHSEVAYNSSTIVYNMKGNKSDISELLVGMMIRFDYDPSKRYFSRPTATKIWIMSDAFVITPK